MGRKKRGSNKMGGAKELKNAVSDDDMGEDVAAGGVYDDVDTWDMEQDKVLLQATSAAASARGRGGAVGGQKREVFALSGTDSDSDFDLPTVRRKKEKKKKQKKVEEMAEEDEAVGMADSDVEEGGGAGAEDDLRAWGSRKKHFYGGEFVLNTIVLQTESTAARYYGRV
jgi:hypothetical protein